MERSGKQVTRAAAAGSHGRTARWTQDPDGVRRDIIAAARAEFVEKGLSGARIDEIAARTATSKRMIYYYFGDKEGLYRAVLEDAYQRMRDSERKLDLAVLPPREALAKLVAASFDYHAGDPGYVRLIMVENIHHARHLRGSPTIGPLNLPAIETVREIYERGVGEGVFRPGLAAIDIHLTIAALGFFNVSNQATVRELFGHDGAEPAIHEQRRSNVIETVLRMVCR
jgi:AcrR family transcriptional regulator